MSKNRRWLLGLVAVLLGSGSVAHAERLPLKSYTTADGLAHDTVQRIVRDSRGFLWFCTEGGLSRFDGTAFMSFGVDQGFPLAPVYDLLETRNGEYWVATGAGLVRFDPRGRAGRRGVSPHQDVNGAMFTLIVPADEDRRARTIMRLLEGRDGTLWAGARKGLYRLDRTTRRASLQHVEIGLRRGPELAEITDVIEDRLGRLWIATPDGLIRRWADGTTARYSTELGIPKWFLSDLFEDHRGGLWFAVRDGGFFRFSADETRAPPVLTMKIPIATAWINQLFETSDGRFWVAGLGGFSEFFPDGERKGTWRSYGVVNGLSEPGVNAMAEDLAGNLWLAVGYAGAMRLSREGLTTFGRPDGLHSVYDVFEDRDSHLCFRGFVLGDPSTTTVFEGAHVPLVSVLDPYPWPRLGCFDGQRFEVFAPARLPPDPKAWGWIAEGVTLQARSGEWWLGSASGVFQYPAADHFSLIKATPPRGVFLNRGTRADRPAV